MIATISELWETGRQIISYNNEEYSRPQTFSDLKKCDNVIIGEKRGPRTSEVLIDDAIVLVCATQVNHPQGGKMYVLEVY
jgi:hypothetical protein